MFILGVFMVVLALAASLYPAHYILKIRPAEAMRKY
jgi:ABC-type lipoprotein release transport system permease subunit